MITKIKFYDTKNAFGRLSDKELNHQVFLFRWMASPIRNMVSKIFVKICIFLRIYWPVYKTAFGHFCGGEDIQECSSAISQLFENNITTILDYSVENGNETSYDSTAEEIKKTILAAANDHRISFAVFKFTGLASKELLEKISLKKASNDDSKKFDLVKKRVELLCKTAYENDVTILVDAEDSYIQKAIDDVTETMMLKYNKTKSIVYNTVQLYRKDRLQFLKDQHTRLTSAGCKAGFKLARGAYMDAERERAKKLSYESPINESKKITDEMFNSAVLYCVENISTISICIGSHNETSCHLLAGLMDEKGIAVDDKRIFFAQLKGMADHISNNLALNGYNVAKYVPYGKIGKVIPYLFRRANENKSVHGEVGRELNIRLAEKKRRMLKSDE